MILRIAKARQFALRPQHTSCHIGRSGTKTPSVGGGLRCAIFLYLSMAFGSQAIADEGRTYQFLVNKYALSDYQEFIQGRDPLSITDVNGEAISRHTMEMFIFQVAPVLGGCECRIHYGEYNIDTPHARAIVQVKKGLVISHPISGMGGDLRLQDGVYLSTPILDESDFYVGLYTDEKRTDLFAVTDPKRVKNLRFAVVHNWEVDRRLIQDRRLSMVETDDWLSLLKMIVASRADIILQPFSSAPDLSFIDSVLNKKFKPLPGIKMKFGQSRQYFVSKLDPHGESFLSALNDGIQQFKESGLLRMLQVQSGVINPNVENWALF